MLKVEIDINKQNQVGPATEFAKRYGCPAIVIPPDLASSTMVARSVAMATHKIMVAVDWPKGTQFLSDKFRGMASAAINVDGFEILLTPCSKLDTIREVRFLSDFFRDHFPPTVEMRFVIGWFGQNRAVEHFDNILNACRQIPTPAMIRTTHLTKLPMADGTVSSHKEIIDKIVATKMMPIKLSGNINSQVRLSCKLAARFACTLEQATTLNRELSDNISKTIEQDTSTNKEAKILTE